MGASAMVELAMASYLSLYPSLLLPPLLLLCKDRQTKVQELVTVADVDVYVEVSRCVWWCGWSFVGVEFLPRWIMGFPRINLWSHVLNKTRTRNANV